MCYKSISCMSKNFGQINTIYSKYLHECFCLHLYTSKMEKSTTRQSTFTNLMFAGVSDNFHRDSNSHLAMYLN